MEHANSVSREYKLKRRKRLVAEGEIHPGGDGCYYCYRRLSEFKKRKRNKKQRNWKKMKRHQWG